jgi:hypothetical protein
LQDLSPQFRCAHASTELPPRDSSLFTVISEPLDNLNRRHVRIREELDSISVFNLGSLILSR